MLPIVIIHDIIKEGTQINLVRPRRESGIIFPELIIVEPDYLVDISTVAKCFESYAESHIVHLLAKIQPFANNQPILLGNFASQLLDEEIHGCFRWGVRLPGKPLRVHEHRPVPRAL